MQMNYTLYVCGKAGTVTSAANCIATVNSDFSMLALSLSPARLPVLNMVTFFYATHNE